MKKAFLGIDTSNYTTSVALVSDSGEVIANLKLLSRILASLTPLSAAGMRARFSHIGAAQKIALQSTVR